MDSILAFVNEEYLPSRAPLAAPLALTQKEKEQEEDSNVNNTHTATAITPGLKSAAYKSIAAFEAAMAKREEQGSSLQNSVMKEEEQDNQDDVEVKKERGASEPPLLARSGSEEPLQSTANEGLHAITTVKQQPQLQTQQGDNDIKAEHGALQSSSSNAAAISANNPNPDHNINSLAGPQQIQAYAKLEFSFLNFYIQKLSVTIGRRPPPAEVKPAVAAAVPAADGESKSGITDASEAASAVPLSLEELLASTAAATGDAGGAGGLAADPSAFLGSLGQAGAASSSSALPLDGDPAALSSLASTSKNTAAAALAEAALASNKVHVDVDLGPIKAVSRDHARLFFDTEIDPRTNFSYGWSIEVRGRNGLVVDGSWKAKSEVVRLNNGCVDRFT